MKFTFSKSSLGNLLRLSVIFGALAVFIFNVDLTKVIFRKTVEELKQPNITETMSKEQYAEVRELWKKQYAQTVQPIKIQEIQKEEIKPTIEQYPQGTIFQYKDVNGVSVMVDSLENVPSHYRQNMKVSGGSYGQQRTPVEVVNNQIYVPVSISYQGRTVTARLLLDTGATGITVSPAIAQRLGVRTTSQGMATLADGRHVQTAYFDCDRVTVGVKTKVMSKIAVMPRNGTEETGLLGMSFLSDFPHTIDVKAKVVRWL